MTISPLDAADLRALGDLLGAAETYARSELAKASLSASVSARNAMLDEASTSMATDLGAYFEAMAKRVGATIKKAQPFDWTPASIDWAIEDTELGLVLVRWWETLGEDAYLTVSEQLGVEVAWDVKSEGVSGLLDKLGKRIKGINETSRQLIADAVDRAAADGLSVDQLARSIRDEVASWASTPEGGAASRSWMIAATETATAYNTASVTGYRESGLLEEVNVYDGEGDPECAAANGSVWTLDEAEANPTEHPNCQRAFGPVVAR